MICRRRRRRRDRRFGWCREADERRGPAATHPASFLVSDGWLESELDGEPMLESEQAALGEWERLRQGTWRLWAKHRAGQKGPFPYPPFAAERHDGLRPGDLHDVAEFKGRRPDAAGAIAVELEMYVAHIRWAADEAERRPKASQSAPLYASPDPGGRDE